MRKTITLAFAVLLVISSLVSAQDVQVATTLAFAEGPTADADGNVYFTDQTNNRIMRLGVDGKLSTFRQPANYANGMVFDSQWRLLVCESGDPVSGTLPRVTRTDMKTGQLEVLADGYEGKHFIAPNDITFDGKGRIYFSDKPLVPGITPSPVPGASEAVSKGGSIALILMESLRASSLRRRSRCRTV